MGDRGSLRRRSDGTYGWNLAKNEREVLTHVAKDFRALLAAETPSFGSTCWRSCTERARSSQA